MDTKKDSAISDVPTFKVARVGKDRKRKGGALSFLRGGGARGGFSGATGGAGAGAGGSGAAGMFASSFAKTMMSMLLASGVGAAAIGAGYMGLLDGREQKPAKKPEVFSNKEAVKIEGDTSNLPSSANTIPNSMGYVTGSTDGLTPEERAAKKAAAEAEAARVAAEEEAKRKAEEEAAAKAGAVDPNALLASAQKDGGNNERGNAFGKKFGQLSSSMGGGSALAGGAGMAGGVGRSFGGMGSISKGSKGQLGAGGTTARPTMKASASSKVAKSNVKGFARQQLANANALSRRGMTASRGETAAYDASSAFDNNQGAGNVITGAGIGNGARPTSDSDGSANPNTTSQPLGQNQPTDCPANQGLIDGVCQTIETPHDSDATKNAWMYKLGQTLIAMVVAATALWWVGAATIALFGVGVALQRAANLIIGIAAYALVALGIAMMVATGDKLAGGIFTATGALMMILCETGLGTTALGSTLAVAGPAILGGFAAAGAHKPEAAGQ